MMKQQQRSNEAHQALPLTPDDNVRNTLGSKSTKTSHDTQPYVNGTTSKLDRSAAMASGQDMTMDSLHKHSASRSRMSPRSFARSPTIDTLKDFDMSEQRRSSVSADANGSASTSAMAGGLVQSTVPVWANTAVMASLIFGGCCSNVFALEAIVKEEPDSGHLITFIQFLFVAIEGFIHFFDSKSPTYLAPNQIPLRRWFGVILLFFSVSLLNNFVFSYHISVPVHIILRSGGSMTTMLLGAFMGRKYSRVQVLSVAILTVGIIVSAMSNAKSIGESEHSLPRFMTGLTILFVSQLLAAIMGVYIESTYEKYGSNWREGLFYTHALSLPLFLPFASQIYTQYLRLYHSTPIPLFQGLDYLPASITAIQVPHQIFYLIINAITQYVCVRGVNFLSGMSSALTVTIVLNIRKLVSLMLSIWLFGNRLSPGVVGGASIVFISAFMYGLESQRQGRIRREAAARTRRPSSAATHAKD